MSDLACFAIKAIAAANTVCAIRAAVAISAVVGQQSRQSCESVVIQIRVGMIKAGCRIGARGRMMIQ